MTVRSAIRTVFVVLPVAAGLLNAAPAAAWSDFHNWNFCSQNSLQVCMDFQLRRDGATQNYELKVTYLSTLAPAGNTGFMTAAGLYRTGAADLNVSNLSVFSTTPNLQWKVNAPQLGGDGPITLEVTAGSKQGVNNGLPVGGSVTLRFKSNNLATYNMNNLHARAHIQSFGTVEPRCSLKPDSRSDDNLVGSAAAVDESCGILPPPPPPPSEVPEPMTVILLGSGVLALGAVHRRRQRVS